ncbi:MAG: hypothetical protein KFH87_04210 [Bacteroidetes bacterium]|nr:hypothetical protein [Bacteroidota bacterium]
MKQGSLIASLFVLLFITLSACSDSIVTECDIALPEGVAARFSEIEERVFATTCAIAGCHGGTNPASGLDLSPGQAYAQLVDVPSLNDPARMRVEPGSSAQSLLISLLRREAQPFMPPAGPLDAAVIDSIATWIDAGAERN